MIDQSTITLQLGDPGRDNALGNGGIFKSSQGFSIQISQYESYVFHQNFMHPTASFTFVLGPNSDGSLIKLAGATVSLEITTPNGYKRAIATGIVDQVNERISEHGSFVEIRGRDFLSKASDDGIDPISSQFEFAEGQTLGQLLAAVFNQYLINTFYTTDAFARDIVTGVNYSNPATTRVAQTVQVPTVSNLLDPDGNPVTTFESETVTVWHDPSNPNDLEQLKLKRCKPEWGETAYSFAETHCKRFHLHLWGMPDGSGVVVGKPDFDQTTNPPLYVFNNRQDGLNNNTISTKLDADYCNMPNLLLGRVQNGGGDTPYTGTYCYSVNEFTGYKLSSDGINHIYLDAIQVVLNRFRNSNGVTGIVQVIRSGSGALLAVGDKYFQSPNVARTVWWDDKTSKTVAELEASMARRMSEFQRNALRYTVVVQGHAQNNQAYRFNTHALVHDEDWGIKDEIWWIESVTFSQSVTGGTTTEIVMIPPFVLNF